MIKEYTAFFPCCGSGGGAIGAAKASAEFKGHVGKFKVVGGIDVDPEACEDFQNFTGAPAWVMDLFGREDYIAYHGHLTPEDWHEVTPAEIRLLLPERPDVVFISAPCQGNSGLLSEEAAASDKYQALNNLSYHVMWLMLEAWHDDPVPVFLFENVPRITTRSKHLLNRIRMLLRSYGYETHPQKDKDGFHDCGEVGGLGQHRKRYMMISRHREKCSAIIYRPAKRKMKTIGEVLGNLPLPGDPAAGPMHQLPRLTWRTCERLAIIRAGKDWRDIENCPPYRIEYNQQNGFYYVVPLEQNINTSDSRLRLNLSEDAHKNMYRILPWNESAPTVTGALGVNNGALAVGDPRLGCSPRNGTFKVQSWYKPANTVTASGDVHAGSSAVADPRIPADHERLDPVPVIISMDGTWHRPLTDYENAALQSFPLIMPDGNPLTLAGNSSARWRKRIGNAVPPDSAQHWFESIAMSLLASDANDWFLSSNGMWVIDNSTSYLPYEVKYIS